MSPKAKTKSFPPVKVTEEFLKATKQIAEQQDKYLSDYIRLAVEHYNRIYTEKGYGKHYNTHNRSLTKKEKEAIIFGDVDYNTHHQQDSKINFDKFNAEQDKVKNSNVDKMVEKYESLNQSKPTIAKGDGITNDTNAIQNGASIKGAKPTMVQQFGKGK